ncbi:hypothetical protein K7X08_014848 [Anisodus acutangulus]|uniref:Uncharacterized protein n=1 Tax=Anisodus acutangulus TaxID=402998 RepID=A0A9Q1LJA5_9SOLA|nr:hypothetical protein K7X08_014848 [Anisodus acutangulus]
MDLEVNDLSLIDFSSENDNLIGNSSSPLPSWGLEEYPSPGATNIEEEMDMACRGNNDEQFPQLHESKEPEKARRKGKVNLRKSLAWDSAFLTDAGVLDAEELSSMIKGGDKQSLPMIEEDVRQSFDSISTLESDNLTLEHIEAELFGDIRASIQKVAIPSSGDVSAKTDNGANSSAKKVDLASKDMMKPKLAPKRIIGAQAGIPRSQPKQITGTQRLGKGLNQDKTQVTQSISRTTSRASLKPPKISTKLQPVSASKRASLDITRVKTDNDSTKTSSASVRGAQAVKASASKKASRVLPKPTLSMKQSSVGSSPAMKIHATRSSSDSSGSTSSDKTAKSSIPVARRKVDSKPIAQPSASAKLKTPSKFALKSKLPSGNSAVSAYLMSSKINSSISPASSISDWSSISSSSSATINQRSSKLRTSFDTSSCRSFDSDTSTLDLKNHLSDQTSDKLEIRGTTLPRESLKQAGTVSRPASMMKPSGLRMPSPKMGYFDGVKAVRTPNGTQSSSSAALPKNEAIICSPKGNSNSKAKSVKVPLRATRKPETLKHVSPVSSSDKSNVSDNHAGAALPKTEATICSPKGNSNTKAKSVRVPLRANRKPETLKHLSPVSSSDKSNVSDNHSGASSDITLISELSLEVHHEIIGADASKNVDVVVEEPDPFEHVQSAGLVASKSENKGIASTLHNEEVVAEGPDTVEHVADDGLVAIKSENQIIANTLKNKEVVAEGPDTVEHIADDGLVANKSENEVIVNNDTVLIKSESQSILNNKEVVAEGPDAIEHVVGDGLVVIESENQVTVNNDTNVIKGENQRIEEVVADEPGAVEHVAGDGLVANKSENEVIVNNDTNVIKSEYQRIQEIVADEADTVEYVAGDGSVAIESENQRIEEVVADEPDAVEHVAGDGSVAIKSENQVILNKDTNVIKSENQRIEELVADELDAVEYIAGDCSVAIKSENQVIVNNDLNVIQSENQRIEEVVADESDAVEHAAGDGLVVIKSENQCVLNNDMVAGLDTIKNIAIRTAEVTVSENIRQCQTEDGDGEGVQCNVNYNLDVPRQMNEMNLEDNVNGDFKNTKIDHVEREYDSTFTGAETMPQCQTKNEGRVDVKDDLNTLEETNAEKNVCANQADQLNSQVEEVSTTPFSIKVESLMHRLAYLSLNTPATAIRRIPCAVKNSSGDCLDFC